ncbi:MAG: EF-hand domain-containing protein [Betaproteobacteria bacterium]
MHKSSILTAAVALSVLIAMPAVALADSASRLDAKFKKADKDSDGTLTKDEARAMPRVAKHFDTIDADKDGTVSLDEIKTSMAGAKKNMHNKGEAAFKKADKNSDGKLDKDEAKAMRRVAKNFDAIDADKDGTVSLDEIHAFMKAKHAGAPK